jgi:tRNA dimethylallyltransferase
MPGATGPAVAPCGLAGAHGCKNGKRLPLWQATPTREMPRPLCAIMGPTASGKSALAHAVARESGAEILSVDSMTVYRGMDIGTAKPDAEQRREVVYHGLDLVNCDETFTVARWLELADRVVARATAPLVLVGGTPLYFQAVFQGLFEGPPADPAFRLELAGIEPAELYRQLKTVDPAAAERIHPNDRKRMTRALEVFRATGRTISEQQSQWESPTPRHPSVRFALSWPREELNRRINARTRQMLAAGWLQETSELLKRHGDFSPTAAEAAGYCLLSQVARGERDLEEAVEQIKIRTRQLVKRQMTWFRRFRDVQWLPGDAPLQSNVEAVLRAWS